MFYAITRTKHTYKVQNSLSVLLAEYPQSAAKGRHSKNDADLTSVYKNAVQKKSPLLRVFPSLGKIVVSPQQEMHVSGETTLELLSILDVSSLWLLNDRTKFIIKFTLM